MIPFVTHVKNFFLLSISKYSLKMALLKHIIKLNHTLCVKIHHLDVDNFSKNILRFPCWSKSTTFSILNFY